MTTDFSIPFEPRFPPSNTSYLLVKTLKPHIWWLLLAFLAVAGLCYWLFVKGYAPGIYPFALAYITLFALPNALLGLALGFLSPLWAIAVLVCGGLALYTRRRIYRQAVIAIFMLVGVALVLSPAWISFDPGPSQLVESWGRFYRTAYSSLTVDDNYGDVLLFECDRAGILCRRVYRYGGGYIGILDDLKLTYNSQSDRLGLRDGSDAIYVRSRNEPLCANGDANGSTDNPCVLEP